MIQFFHDMPHNPFLLSGLLAGLLASLACGVIGPYVITRRIVFLSGAIAHMSVGGLGAAIWLNTCFPGQFPWLRPLHGAILASLLAAVLVGLVHQRVAENMDTLIGAMWAVGMAAGILLIKLTPGYHTELMSYLFGNIALVSPADLRLLVALNAVILLSVTLFHKRLLAICLDQQQAELQGISVLGTNIVLLCLVGLTVICLMRVVGLILVIALICLPAATVGHYVKRMPSMMWLSFLLCAGLSTLPRVAVYGTPASAESAIVLSAAGVYLLSVICRGAVDRLRRT